MDEVLTYFKTRKNIINLLLFLILAVGIPVGVSLLQNRISFQSRADVVPIEYIVDNKCVLVRNGVKVARCADVSIQLTSPLGPPVPVAQSSTQSASR
jgi:hypothetical protein